MTFVFQPSFPGFAEISPLIINHNPHFIHFSSLALAHSLFPPIFFFRPHTRPRRTSNPIRQEDPSSHPLLMSGLPLKRLQKRLSEIHTELLATNPVVILPETLIDTLKSKYPNDYARTKSTILLKCAKQTLLPPSTTPVPDPDLVEILPTPPKRPRTTPNPAKNTLKEIEKDPLYTPGQSVQFLPSPLPTQTLETLSGIHHLYPSLLNLIIHPLHHPEIPKHLGLLSTTHVLLHGPPGCGKTHLALAIAGTAKVPFFRISGPEIVSGISGESEALLRSLFTQLKAHAPSLLFIDEVDCIGSKRDSSNAREMERRIVSQLFACLDDLHSSQLPVTIIAATSRLESLDPGLRRAGRFDREIPVGIPDEETRLEILKSLLKNLRTEEEIDVAELARKTPGYVAADLSALIKEASLQCLGRVYSALPRPTSLNGEETGMSVETAVEVSAGLSADVLDTVKISKNDFTLALGKVQPSAKREGFCTVPDITWDDIGALGGLREELSRLVLQIKHPKLFEKLSLSCAPGALLYGPPGCGKTLVAKVTARMSGANFISVKGPELLNKYVGESERSVRELFQRARDSRPCVVFFDELDSLTPRRGGENAQATERLVNQLLTELDGINDRSGVLVIGATNRPEIIDDAVLRPGRLDSLLYVPLCDEQGRYEILLSKTRKLQLDSDTDLKYLAHVTEGYSGADLTALVKEATMVTIEKILKETHGNLHGEIYFNDSNKGGEERRGEVAEDEEEGGMDQLTARVLINQDCFVQAMRKVKPSVTKNVHAIYEKFIRERESKRL